MTAPPSATALLEEWRRLTVAESKALRARDWPQVRACQEAKQQLRTLLPSPPALPAGRGDLLGRLVNELLELEAANSEWLAGEVAGLRDRLQQLEGSAHNLKRVRNSYVRAADSRWQSYS